MDKQMGKEEQFTSQNLPQTGDQTDTGLSDLAFDWVTILHSKTEGLRAYSTYIEDARKANAQECVQLLERIRDADRRMVEEIKAHVAQVLVGKMGNQNGGAKTQKTQGIA